MILIMPVVQALIAVMCSRTAKTMLYCLFFIGCAGLLLKYSLIIILIALLLYKYMLEDS